jgi:hypothetical protein
MLSISDEEFAGFRVRGLYAPWEQAWRIKTWPTGRGQPEHDYWVRGEELYTVRYPTATTDNYWHHSTIGTIDITMTAVERKAVLHLIAKWEFIAQRSG